MKKLIFIFIFLLSISSCSTIQSESGERNPSNFQSCFELMNGMINYVQVSGPAAKTFGQAKSLKELEGLYGEESLIEIQRRFTKAEIKANNKNVSDLLSASYKTETIKGKKKRFTLAEADFVYRQTEESNVNRNHDCYDSKGTIGFCFGRATIAHMEAAILEIHPESVKKIWVAGDMGFWGHHVATMVYTTKGWMVLDTNYGGKVDAAYWMKEQLKMKEGDKDIMVFVTQAGRFGPYDTTPYNPYNLFNTDSEDFKKAQDFYNGYFHDYFNDLDKQIKSK